MYLLVAKLMLEQPFGSYSKSLLIGNDLFFF
jgi:hypothetical protein